MTDIFQVSVLFYLPTIKAMESKTVELLITILLIHFEIKGFLINYEKYIFINS